ncbi:hypothetical protein ACH3XW_10205 [Acanthocheilonema viteae]
MSFYLPVVLILIISHCIYSKFVINSFNGNLVGNGKLNGIGLSTIPYNAFITAFQVVPNVVTPNEYALQNISDDSVIINAFNNMIIP